LGSHGLPITHPVSTSLSRHVCAQKKTTNAVCFLPPSLFGNKHINTYDYQHHKSTEQNSTKWCFYYPIFKYPVWITQQYLIHPALHQNPPGRPVLVVVVMPTLHVFVASIKICPAIYQRQVEDL
jgi:hypothetical protein